VVQTFSHLPLVFYIEAFLQCLYAYFCHNPKRHLKFTKTFAKSNLCLMTNVKMLLGLNAIMPLLEEVHSLIKSSQLHDMFVCDFIAIVKICEIDVYMMYYDNHYYFQGDMFENFHAFINNVHKRMSFWWIMDLNIGTISPIFWICWVACLGHTCRSDGGI